MGNSLKVDGRAPIHAFYSSKAWIEGAAVQQLEAVAALPGIRAVASMPDLHPGKYGPVGCAILADAIHPAFVGGDIGCGMALFALDLPLRKLRVDRAAERLRSIECPWDAGSIVGTLRTEGLAPSSFDASLGTIGGGNHFCELQAVEDILAPDVAEKVGLNKERAFLLVHSGSRGLGHAIMEEQVAEGLRALAPESEEGRVYLAKHDHALRWASLNRRIIAMRAAEALRTQMRLVCEQSHNLAELRGDGVLHRKGAAPSDKGLAPLPGSRGALSYVVEPMRDAAEESLASLAHGAGRKYDRKSMFGRVGKTRSDRERLARNPFGGIVLCEDRYVLIEEAPEAYKSIDRVIEDLESFGLARPVASFRPLVTLKRVAPGCGCGEAR